MEISRKGLADSVITRLELLSGESVRGCYQCGRCSAGCPMAEEMEALPHKVVRWLQLGLADRAAACKTIWLCASCHTCAARCPRGVDLSRIMEAVRVHLLRRGPSYVDVGAQGPDVPQQALVGGLRKYSR